MRQHTTCLYGAGRKSPLLPYGDCRAITSGWPCSQSMPEEMNESSQEEDSEEQDLLLPMASTFPSYLLHMLLPGDHHAPDVIEREAEAVQEDKHTDLLPANTLDIAGMEHVPSVCP